jgi:hypothetical protein
MMKGKFDENKDKLKKALRWRGVEALKMFAPVD